jgi:hypothetical protein
MLEEVSAAENNSRAMGIDMPALREALEASWDERTSYLAVSEAGNPACGQCYATSRVVQLFFPQMEIVEGTVWTGRGTETHFWNVLDGEGTLYHVDLTWQQFPHGSVVKSWRIRDRRTLGDGERTVGRVELLRDRANAYLHRRRRSFPDAAEVDHDQPSC